MEGSIHAKRWAGKKAPQKILVIRFQALGDTIITLPYLVNLKNQYPDCEIHLLTRKEVSHIPRSISLFKHIFVIGGKRNAKLQAILTLIRLPYLLAEQYDAVLDLQNNKISRLLRKLLRPKSWTEFDLYSPISAGERTRRTIESLWSWKILFDRVTLPKNNGEGIHHLLERNGHRVGHEIVILNPAGFCSSRNWPLENYVEFAHSWRKKINPLTQFVLLLLPVHHSKAKFLKERLGDFCIDLTGQANQFEAFQILSGADLVLTEDSGLMHMAWIQKIPTIALFSSSRKDWSGPQGEWSVCLDSSDLPCGPCELTTCRFGDNRCLTRYNADILLDEVLKLRSLKVVL